MTVEVRPLRERNPRDCDQQRCPRVADWEVRVPIRGEVHMMTYYHCMEHAKNRLFSAVRKLTIERDAG